MLWHIITYWYVCCISVVYCWLLQLGRRLVPRSEPPQPKKVLDEVAEQASREEEELAYYFMPWLFLITLVVQHCLLYPTCNVVVNCCKTYHIFLIISLSARQVYNMICVIFHFVSKQVLWRARLALGVHVLVILGSTGSSAGFTAPQLQLAKDHNRELELQKHA